MPFLRAKGENVMAERTSAEDQVFSFASFATRPGFPALLIGIVLGLAVLGFLAASFANLGGDQDPIDLIFGQDQELEEEVSTQEVVSTDTPSPTETEVPPTNTPTQTPTGTPTPTVTPTVTLTPYPTPELNEWTDAELRDFVSWTILEILLDHKFQTTLPCYLQDRSWSEDVDPFIREYLPTLEACVYVSNGDRTSTTVLDESILERIWSGEIALLDNKSPETHDTSGNYHLKLSLTDDQGEFVIILWDVVDYLYSRSDVPEWEWAAFVERNFRDYGWWFMALGTTWEARTEWVQRYLYSSYGIPGYYPYVPNFDPDSPYYMFESKRLGLGEYAVSTQTPTPTTQP